MKRNFRKKKMTKNRPLRRGETAPHRRGWNGMINILILLGVWLSGVLMLHLGGPRRHVGLAEGQIGRAHV